MKNTENIALSKENAKRNYNGIDLIKFICAFLVCAIHIPPLPSQTPDNGFLEQDIFGMLNVLIQGGVCRIAVPFFFAASGFFLFKKMGYCSVDKDTVRDYCFKLLRFIGIWSVLLLVGRVDHLWYLGATVVAVIALSYCIYKKIKLKYIAIFACGLYAIGLIGDLYYGLLDPARSVTLVDYAIKLYEAIFSSTRNGIFMGFIFVFIGAIFAYKKIVMPMAMAWVGFGASLVLQICEVYLTSVFGLPKDYNMSFALLPTVFFLFYIALNIDLKDRPIYKILRAVGVLVFYMHLLVEWFAKMAFKVFLSVTNVDLTPILLPTVIVIVVPLCILIERLSQKRSFSWLKYLYA